MKTAQAAAIDMAVRLSINEKSIWLLDPVKHRVQRGSIVLQQEVPEAEARRKIVLDAMGGLGADVPLEGVWHPLGK